MKVARGKLANWEQVEYVGSFNEDFQKVLLDASSIIIEEQIDHYARALKQFLCTELYTIIIWKKMKFVVAPCQYDIILGKNSEPKQKAKIDHANNHISLSHEGIECSILANESITPVSDSTIINNYNKVFQMFSVIRLNELVSNDSDVRNYEDVSSVLEDHMDVFPEDLPKGLPPKRTETYL